MAYPPCNPKLGPLSSANSSRALEMLPHLPLFPTVTMNVLNIFTNYEFLWAMHVLSKSWCATLWEDISPSDIFHPDIPPPDNFPPYIGHFPRLLKPKFENWHYTLDLAVSQLGVLTLTDPQRGVLTLTLTDRRGGELSKNWHLPAFLTLTDPRRRVLTLIGP